MHSPASALPSGYSSWEKKRKVARRACLACREKKIKCDGEVLNQGPGPSGSSEAMCTNCANSGTECVFVASLRGGRRVPKKPQHQDLYHHWKGPPHAGPPPGHQFYPYSHPPHPPRPHPHHHHHHHHQHHRSFEGGPGSPHHHFPPPPFSPNHFPPHHFPPHHFPPHHFPPPPFHHHNSYRYPDPYSDSRGFTGFSPPPHGSPSSSAHEQSRKSQMFYDTHDYSRDYPISRNEALDLGSSSKSESSVTNSYIDRPTASGSEKMVPSLANILHASEDSSQRPRSTDVTSICSSAVDSVADAPSKQFTVNSFTDNDLQAYGFPTWNHCYKGFKSFYENVHPQFTLLNSESQYLQQFTPSNNTALSHAILVCSSSYLKKDRHSVKSFHLKMVDLHWEKLDLLSSLQTLLLLAFFHLRFASDRELTEKCLTKAIRLAFHSKIYSSFAEEDLEELLTVSPQKVRQQQESYLMILWKLFFTIHSGRMYFADATFCSNISSLNSRMYNLEDLIFPRTLPYHSMGFQNIDEIQIPTASVKRRTIWKESGGFNTAANLLAAIDLRREANVCVDKGKLASEKVLVEEIVNKTLLRKWGEVVLVDFLTLEAKTVLLTTHFEALLLRYPLISCFCSHSMKSCSLPGAYMNESQVALNGDFLKRFEIDLPGLLELFLIIQDCVALLHLADSTLVNWTELVSDSQIIMSTSKYVSLAVEESTDSHLEPLLASMREHYPYEQLHITRDPSLQASSISRQSPDPSQRREIWQHYPLLLQKLICLVVPLQGLLLAFGKGSRISEEDSGLNLLYSHGSQISSLGLPTSNPLEFDFLQSLRFNTDAIDITNDGRSISLLNRLCDSVYMANDFKLCLEFLNLSGAVLENCSNLRANIEILEDWLETLIPSS
ncbi:LANO_0H21858g1_1 [Lachancea nothofagi CBS 11611]|uniref:LANO_0H21858g1_1 n=1 Tax=Lachancea nothofagi CBS 11611 TaxID=1266666 RepID=A0A1G4KNM4_9SACH|nr:LANO_0H21858g1_1 [Lachancea nothofagi CBS 11611]